MISRDYSFSVTSADPNVKVADDGATLISSVLSRPYLPHKARNFRAHVDHFYFTNSARNITASNNKITVDAPTVADPLVIATNEVITIPIGNYNVPDLINTLKSSMLSHTTPLLSTGITFTLNRNTMRTEISISANYRIDFTVDGSPRDILGFGSVNLVPGIHIGSGPPSRGTNTLVHLGCSLADMGVCVGSSYNYVVATTPVEVQQGAIQVYHPSKNMTHSAKSLVDNNIQKVTWYLLDRDLQPYDAQSTLWGAQVTITWEEDPSCNNIN